MYMDSMFSLSLSVSLFLSLVHSRRIFFSNGMNLKIYYREIITNGDHFFHYAKSYILTSEKSYSL